MSLLENFMKRLRTLVGLKSWDYCVVWKISEDQRFIEWVDCCCAGADHHIQNGEDMLCRDVMFPHPKTNSCDLLSQLPSSFSLDSGIHAEALFSDQYRWFNISHTTDSYPMEEIIGTRVLIPFPGGLVELFVTSQVGEDQNMLDFISTQCNMLMEQEPTMINSNFNSANEDLSDITANQIRLSNNSPMNFTEQQHFNFNSENTNNSIFMNNGFEEMDVLNIQNNNDHEEKGNNDKEDSVKQETSRPDSISDCSDQVDDEDDAKYRRRTEGKGPQSKNLVAERKRRKKINDRLYALRSLVPNITKLDRASVLGDAIEFVKELQKEAKELQDELEEQSEDECVKNSCITSDCPNNGQSEILISNNQYGFNLHLGEPASAILKQNHDSDITNDKAHGQQMEAQVEVAQLDGNEFFVKVFCEHRPGGFARLLDALNSLGFEVTNANVTSFRSLVSNVFKVEKRDSEMVQADHVRDSLLALTKHPNGNAGQWPNGNGVDYIHGHQNGSYHRHLHN